MSTIPTTQKYANQKETTKSFCDGMNWQTFREMTDTELALDALEQNQHKRAKFFLRRELSKKTDYMEVGGHIFCEDPTESDTATNKWCRGMGCEMIHPTFAENRPCPSPLESVELLWVDYDDRDEKIAQWEEEYDWGKENE